jgi:hypothetical protein
MTALPEAPAPQPTNGAQVAPLPPETPHQWIILGPRTRAHLARVLEQSPLANPVLVALLETSGVPEGAGYRLVISAAHLEPAPPETPP